MRNRLLEVFFVRATIDAVRPAGRFRAVRLRSRQLSGVDWTPGQQIRLDCGSATALTPLLRTYSVWDHDEDWIDLYCLVHGDGPGSAWADRATTGQAVLLTRPKGDFVTATGTYHLFIGDETASAAFGPMIRALPPGVPARTIVESAGVDDRLPLTGDVTWIDRPAGADAADQGALTAAVASLHLPDEPGVAYVAGEARTIQAVRAALMTGHGWPRRAIHTKPFWAPGKRGME